MIHGYHIQSPIIREPIPPHLEDIFHLMGNNQLLNLLLPSVSFQQIEFMNGKAGVEEAAKNSFEYLQFSFKIDDLMAAILKNSGECKHFTFAYPFRPREGKQNQLSRQLSFKLAEIMNEKFGPEYQFSVIPMYQLQENKRSACDSSLRLQIQSRMYVHDEISLNGKAIIPVEHGLESGETIAQMVSVAIRHGGIVPTTVTMFNHYNTKLAPTKQQIFSIEEKFTPEQRLELDEKLSHLGLGVSRLTSYEMQTILDRPFEETITELDKALVERKEPALTEAKFQNIISRYNSDSTLSARSSN